MACSTPQHPATPFEFSPSMDPPLRNSKQVEALLAAYQTRQLVAVTKRTPGAIAIDELPLARIKRIMKQDSCDPHPRMISADTIPLMAYAAQLFIGSLTSLAWQLSTAPAKRNTLQVKDLKAVIHASSRFDFLIDVLDMFDQQAMNQQPLRAAAPLTAPAPRKSLTMHQLPPEECLPERFIAAAPMDKNHLSNLAPMQPCMQLAARA